MIDDDLYLENYYCFQNEDQILKTTKIFVEGEVIVLTDRITIPKIETKE